MVSLIASCVSAPPGGRAESPARPTPSVEAAPTPPQAPERPPDSALSLLGERLVDHHPIAVDGETIDRWFADFATMVRDGGGALPPDYDADAYLGRHGLDTAAALELADRVELHAIAYESDGLKVRGFVAAPRTAAGPLPCLIVNRGGHEQAPITEVTAFGWLAKMADWGYVVIASNYRGSPGSEGSDEFGGADIADVLNLLPVLESIPRADATRIGLYGVSRGGMMTYLALARSDAFSAAIVHSGAADLSELLRQRPEMGHIMARLIPDFAEHPEDALRARSAAQWADELDPTVPILLLHGAEDWRVAPQDALGMAQALLNAEHPFRFVLLEGEGHSLAGHRDEVGAATRTWLDRYVRDQSPAPEPAPRDRRP